MGVLVKYQPNAFKEEFISKEIKADFLVEALKEFRLSHMETYPHMFKEKVVIVINGKKWYPDDWYICMLEDGDVVEITPAVFGGDGGLIMTIIGAMLIAVGFFLPPPFNLAFIMMGIGMMISGVVSMLAPIPSFLSNETSSDSPSYSWEGPSLTTLSNIPVPVVYGEVWVGGNVISQYTHNDGKDSYLNLLIALSEGPIEGICEYDSDSVCRSTADIPDILINDQSYKIYKDSGADVEWDYRLGTNNQKAVSDFKHIHTYYQDGREITNNWLYYTTNGTSLNKVDLHLFANSLYKLEGESLQNHTVEYDIAYRKVGASNWTTYVWGYYVKYEQITVTRPLTSPSFTTIPSHFFRPETKSVYLTEKQRKSWGSIGVWDTVTTDEISDHRKILSEKIISGNLSGKTRSTVQKTISITFPSAGQYEIRIRRIGKPSTDIKIADRTYWKATDEIITRSLTYPYTALLFLKIKATEVISGHTPNVITKIRGRCVEVPRLTFTEKVPYFERTGLFLSLAWRYLSSYNDVWWDSTTSQYKLLSNGSVIPDTGRFTTQWTQNPLYCVRDFLTNKRYGLGEYLDSTHIDSTYLEEAAKYAWNKETEGLPTGEHKFHLDVCIDNEMEALQILMLIARTFRGWAIWSEGTIKFICDKEGTPVQLLTMGNVIKDSFSENFLPYSKIPNVIECSFANQDRNNQIDVREVVYEPDWVNNKPKRIHKEDFRGVVRESQVIREGTFFLNCARLRTKVISFKAGLDSIHAVAGDLISFQHDVNNWGRGGRITKVVNASTVVVDATFTATTNGVLFCQLSDGTVQEYGAGASPADYTIRTTATAFSPAPRVGGVWAYGKRNIDIQTYRILSISREENDQVGITALEYDANVYTTNNVIVASPVYDTLIQDFKWAPPVENVSLTESFDSPTINVGFTPPLFKVKNGKTNYVTNYSHAEVWLAADNSATGFKFYGNDYGKGDTEIHDVVPGRLYTAKIYSVNKSNVRNDGSPVFGEIYAGLNRPKEPTGLQIDQDGRFSTRWNDKDIKFTWRKVSEIAGFGTFKTGKEVGGFGQWAAVNFDMKYRVEVWKDDSIYRSHILPDNSYTYTYEANRSDFGTPATSLEFRVYSINDRANLLSYGYTAIQVSNKVPDAVSGLNYNSLEDGVEFYWDDNTEKDFSHYSYRYCVATYGGNYTATTDWYSYYNNEIQLYLNANQLKKQGRGVSKIKTFIKSVDLYKDESSIASVIGETFNRRTDLIVSQEGGKGVFTNIASAIDAVPGDGCSIIIKEGTYQIDSKITIPNRNIDMMGVNRDNVIIESVPGDHTFYFEGAGTSKYRFDNFSIKSRTTTAPFSSSDNYMFYFNGVDRTQNRPSVTFTNLKGVLKDNRIANDASGDYLIHMRKIGAGGLTRVDNCIASGGKLPIYAINCDDVIVSNSKLTNALVRCVEVRAPNTASIVKKVEISNNVLSGYGRSLVKIYSTDRE